MTCDCTALSAFLNEGHSHKNPHSFSYLVVFSISGFVPQTVVLHCSNLCVLSVDVTHEQAQFSFGSLQLPRECIQRCPRSERSRSCVVSLSSATPGSIATQHQRSATILTRVVVYLLCIKTTRSRGCTTAECRHGCESQVSGLSHVLKCNCLQNDQDQYRRNAYCACETAVRLNARKKYFLKHL